MEKSYFYLIKHSSYPSLSLTQTFFVFFYSARRQAQPSNRRSCSFHSRFSFREGDAAANGCTDDEEDNYSAVGNGRSQHMRHGHHHHHHNNCNSNHNHTNSVKQEQTTRLLAAAAAAASFTTGQAPGSPARSVAAAVIETRPPE